MTNLPLYKCSSCRNLIGFLAVLAFVSVNVGDIHIRHCLDGLEPAISLHFENLNGHTVHEEDDLKYNDFEYEVSLKSIKIKSSELSKLFLVSSYNGILPSYTFVQKTTSKLEEILLPQEPSSVLPPLRAPPLLIR